MPRKNLWLLVVLLLPACGGGGGAPAGPGSATDDTARRPKVARVTHGMENATFTVRSVCQIGYKRRELRLTLKCGDFHAESVFTESAGQAADCENGCMPPGA